MSDDDAKSCVGVVFQFNAGGVLFEFPDGSGGDAIGFVKITGVKINADNFIPSAAANSQDKLSKYLQVGDEVRCSVRKDPDLPMFEYTEEDEEVDASGEFKMTSKSVQVQPGWVAEVAELVVPVNITEEPPKADPNVTEYEDDTFNLDIGDQLDYDGEFEETEALSPAKVAKHDDDDEEQDKEVAEDGVNGAGVGEETKNGQQAMELDDVILLDDDDADILDFSGIDDGKKKVDDESNPAENSNSKADAGLAKKDETFIQKGRLVQFQKPPIEGGRIFLAILEILEGPFAKQQVVSSNWKISVFGHSLGNVTLNYYLNYGDECEIEYQVSHSKPAGQPHAQAVPTPLVLRTWFGSRTVPVKDDPEFDAWLKSREIDSQQFLNWIQNRLPPKPYLPLIDDVFVCKVTGYIQENNGPGTSGLILKVFSKFASVETVQNSATDPEIAPDLAEDDVEPKRFAILMRDDLYICGVAVKLAELKSLFNIGDNIKCQIRPIKAVDKTVMFKEFSQVPADSKATHIAYLGYVGPKRPQSATLNPDNAAHLDKFLKTKNLGIEDFKMMRLRVPDTQKPPAVQPLKVAGTIPQFIGAGLRPPFVPPQGPFMPPGQFMSAGPFQAQVQPPPGQFPGVVGTFYPQIPPGRIAVATTVAAKAINFCHPPNESQIFTILENPVEIEVAVLLVKNLAQSLMLHMKNNIQSQIVTSSAEIEGQLLQARTAEQVLLKGEADKKAPKNPPLHETYQAVQEKLSQEAQDWAKATEANKSKPVVRDARKILEAYKAAKVRENLREDSSPLNLLREHVSENKAIASDNGTIWFGNCGFPASVLTNFRSSVTDGFYKLETLVHCVKFKPSPDNFLDYARAAQRLGIIPVAKQDIGPLLAYLSSPHAPKPPNVADIAHKDLNPQLFNASNPSYSSDKIAAWKEKYGPEKKVIHSNNSGSMLSKISDADLLAQAELQMATAAGSAGQPPATKRSRFDVTVHPTKGFTEVPPPVLNAPALAALTGSVQVAHPGSGSSGYTQPPPMVLNPFAPSIVQPQPGPEVARYHDDSRSRIPSDIGSRSPTLERMQESRPLSPERMRSPSFRSDRVNPFAQMPDPFKISKASPPRNSTSRDREEEIQMKLWQEFKREREARRRREEEEEEARRRAYEAERLRTKNDDFEMIRKREEEMKREAELERMRRMDFENDRQRVLQREDEDKARARRLETGGAGGGHDDWKRMLGEFEKFEKEVVDRKAIPPPPKIDLAERRAAPPPPTLSQRGSAQPSSYRSQGEYEQRRRQDTDDDLRRRSEWDDRTERRSWSREREWDSVEGRAYRSVSQQRSGADDDDDDRRRRRTDNSHASSSTENWPTIGSGYDRRF